MNNKTRKNHRKISLIELFCTVIVLGTLLAMGIVGLSDLTSKMNNKKELSNEEIAVKACKKFINDNFEERPKNIGEVKYIKLNDLKSKKYLKEDIKKDNSLCMKNSYIRVYKYSNNNYSYIPYIYCGSESKQNIELIPEPTVEIKFMDKNNEIDYKKRDIFNNNLLINLNGGMNTTSEYIGIDHYNFKISTKEANKNDYIEKYSSENIKANYEEKINLTKKLSDYIEITNIEYIKFEITIKNIVGLEKTYNFYF